MKSDKIIKLVTTSLMAAMTCVVTMMIPIKIPLGNGGYIHPGDAFVLLSGIILGPVYGAFAAGIGSMLADIFVGYPFFWITLIIKALAAIVGAQVYRNIRKRPVIYAGIFGGVVVTLGYFIFESIMFGFAGALVGVPFNIIQNIFGIILSSILLPVLLQIPQIKGLMSDNKS